MQREKLKFESLPCLHPAAFAIIMGTGTLACATLAQTDILPFLYWPGLGLCFMAFFIFVALAPYAIISWTKRKGEIRKHLELPGQTAFFATIGIALLVLANQSLFYKFPQILCLVFWFAGAIVTLALNFAIFVRSFLKKLELEHLTPALFIPVTGLVVMPVAGAPLALKMTGAAQNIILLFCVIGLGAGIMLYVGLFGAMMERHLLLAPLPDHLAPTLWIHLAPLGWGALGALALTSAVAGQDILKSLEFLCLLAWGGATWWVVMAFILTLRSMLGGGMRFNMAWWSFIFPLGSYVLLTKRLNFVFCQEIGFCVWCLMVCIWIFAGFKTIKLAWQDCVCEI